MITALVLLLPEGLRPKAKLVVAVIGAVVAALLLSFDWPWLVAASNVLTAWGVYAVPNLETEEGDDGGNDPDPDPVYPDAPYLSN